MTNLILQNLEVTLFIMIGGVHKFILFVLSLKVFALPSYLEVLCFMLNETTLQ